MLKECGYFISWFFFFLALKALKLKLSRWIVLQSQVKPKKTWSQWNKSSIKQAEREMWARTFEQKKPRKNIFCAHLESTEKGWASSASVQVCLHALRFLIPWKVSSPLGSQGRLSLSSQIALTISPSPFLFFFFFQSPLSKAIPFSSVCSHVWIWLLLQTALISKTFFLLVPYLGLWGHTLPTVLVTSIPVTDTGTVGLGIIVQSMSKHLWSFWSVSKRSFFIELSTVTYQTFAWVVNPNSVLLSVFQLFHM